MFKRKPMRRIAPVRQNCNFCIQGTSPTFKDTDTIIRFTTDRGKIVPKARSGLCRRHQRLVTIAVKRARYLALLPFVPLAQ